MTRPPTRAANCRRIAAATVRAEWKAFWADSPCVELVTPADAGGGAWLLGAALLLLALLGAPAAALAVPRYRRKLRGRALALLGEVPLLGLTRQPPSQSQEHVSDGRWLVRPNSPPPPGTSRSFSAKLTSGTSLEICGVAGGAPSAPAAGGAMARILSLRAPAPPPAVPLHMRGGRGAPSGRSFQADSSPLHVAIQADEGRS